MSMESKSIKTVEYNFKSGDISMLEGILLTIADASFQDQEQRRAFKDILRQNIWRWAIECNGNR